MRTTGYTFKERQHIGGASPSVSVMEDESREGNNPALTNVTFTQNARGLWLPTLNGSNSTMIITGDCIGVGDVTFLTWLYLIGWGEGNVTFLVTNAQFTVALTQINARFLITSDNGGSVKYSSNNVLSLATWFFIGAVRWEDGTATLYLDGAPTGTQVQASGTPTAGGNVYLGCDDDGTDTGECYLAGSRIIHRALDREKIREAYERERRLYGV